MFVCVSMCVYVHDYNSIFAGLAVQLISLNTVYLEVVKTYNRVLVLAPFTSEHYKDVGWIHLCDYFDFPDNIVCTSEKPVDIVSRMPCVVDCSNKDWPCHAGTYILTCTFMNVFIYSCICIYIYLYIYIYVCVYTCVRLCVCVYI